MPSSAELQLVVTVLNNAQKQLSQIEKQLVGVGRSTGKAATGADAFNRANSRLLAGFGLISPSMATATSQIESLTNVSGAATIAIGALTVAGIGLALIGSKTVKAFSNLNEAINKSNQVFRGASGVVDEFSKSSAKSFGISQRAALEYAATLGNIILASGASRSAAADMSVALLKLAADMASFNNIPIADALEKIQAGLVGEVRPLREIGVLLSESAVQNEAARIGIAELGDELTDGQKVQARYSLILRATAVQQGDFQRTSKELANSQRILSARFEDASARLGRNFLPAAILLVNTLNVAVTGLNLLASGLQFVTSHADLTGAALLGLLAVLTGPVGLIGVVVFLGFRWKQVFDQLPAPVQSAAIAIANIFDTMANFILGRLQDIASGIDAMIGRFNRIPGLPNVPKIGDLGLPESNIAATLRGLQGGGEGQGVFGAARQIRDLIRDFKSAQEVPFPELPPAAEAEKAGKALDILADGIITLDEALAAGLSNSQVVALELQRTLDDLAREEFRVTIETEKLGTILGARGLTGQAGILQHAMRDLGEGFRKAGESITGFLDRLANAALKATQTAFDALFNRPTRETAAVQLQVTRLQRQRLLLEQGGATDQQLKAIDDQIVALQRNIELTENKNKILELEAVLADKTLLTDQQLNTQAVLLIGVISQESALVSSLNTQLAYEILARAGATTALREFTAAVQAAQSVFGLGTGVQVNVSLNPQLSQLGAEVLRTVNRETERALTRVGFGGTRAMSGALRP
ncbi:MAG TPA: hypothetical protein VJB57_19410 [Dehalococcoidia bacterium]|nr:hypothetical protein [Dehalococcoidia bacterium]